MAAVKWPWLTWTDVNHFDGIGKMVRLGVRDGRRGQGGPLETGGRRMDDLIRALDSYLAARAALEASYAGHGGDVIRMCPAESRRVDEAAARLTAAFDRRIAAEAGAIPGRIERGG